MCWLILESCYTSHNSKPLLRVNHLIVVDHVKPEMDVQESTLNWPSVSLAFLVLFMTQMVQFYGIYFAVSDYS